MSCAKALKARSRAGRVLPSTPMSKIQPANRAVCEVVLAPWPMLAIAASGHSFA